MLARPVAVAGEPVGVRCLVFDAHDNPVTEFARSLALSPFGAGTTAYRRRGHGDRRGRGRRVLRGQRRGLTADLHAGVRLTLGTAADGSIDVGDAGATASVGPVTPGFTGEDGEELDALIAIGGNDVRALVEGLLVDLIPAFTDRLPPLLESVLGAADQLLDGVRFTIAPLSRPVTVELGGRLGALDVAAGAVAGHVTVRQDLAIRTSGTPIHPASRGAPQLVASPGDPVLSTAGLSLAIRQDLLNALFHALWNAGLLEGSLAVGGLTAVVSARLPPVVRPTPAASPCKIDGERCDLLLELGQLEIQLSDLAQSFGVHASAGIRIEVHDGSVSLAIQSQPALRVWETSATPGTFTPDVVRQLIAAAVWPGLLDAIDGNLTIALPLPDLAALGLGDLAPGLASAQLALQMRQRPSAAGGQLVRGADLAFQAPRP